MLSLVAVMGMLVLMAFVYMDIITLKKDIQNQLALIERKAKVVKPENKMEK